MIKVGQVIRLCDAIMWEYNMHEQDRYAVVELVQDKDVFIKTSPLNELDTGIMLLEPQDYTIANDEQAMLCRLSR